MFRLFPDEHIAGLQLLALGRSKPPRDERQDVEPDCLEDDVGISCITQIFTGLSVLSTT